MNIKSLLLGSAAALLAVSGARAADAVTVAEPEPAEYVKICDVYGAGYFYIPEDKQWKHLVSFSTLASNQLLRGYYSFIEDFKRDRISATKVRKAHFAVDDGQIKPYLQLDSIIAAAFDVAGKLFDLTFTERKDLPVYHPEVRIF